MARAIQPHDGKRGIVVCSLNRVRIAFDCQLKRAKELPKLLVDSTLASRLNYEELHCCRESPKQSPTVKPHEEAKGARGALIGSDRELRVS